MDYSDIKFEEQIKMKWKVKEDDLKNALKTNGSINSKTEKTIKIPGIRYYLSLEEDDIDPDEINVMLHLNFKHTKSIHKWVLCAKSPVFKAEMESDFSYEIVNIFVKYCYERDIQYDLQDLDDEDAIEVIHFADKYDVKDLHVAAQTFMSGELCEENIVDFSNAAVKYNAHDLREFCISFLLKYAGKNNAIKDAKDLDTEITNEVGRRCLTYASD